MIKEVEESRDYHRRSSNQEIQGRWPQKRSGKMLCYLRQIRHQTELTLVETLVVRGYLGTIRVRTINLAVAPYTTRTSFHLISAHFPYPIYALYVLFLARKIQSSSGISFVSTE